MKYIVVFFLLGSYLAVAAVLMGDVYWLLLWPAANSLMLSAGYAGLGPAFLGKRSSGRFAPWSVLMLPYLAGTWVLWHIQRRVVRGPACHEVAPGLWLGRRPLPHELPPGIDLIVDLTAEFFESARVRRGRQYLCVPTLDCTAPTEQAFREAIQHVASWNGTVYIHCAAGLGRSATLAAAVLIVRGLASDATAAERMLQAVRPGVGLAPSQRALLVRVVPSLIRPAEQSSQVPA